MIRRPPVSALFDNETASTDIYARARHDALQISAGRPHVGARQDVGAVRRRPRAAGVRLHGPARRSPRGVLEGHRSEEHTSELQSRQYLGCRLLLAKKKINSMPPYS